MVTKELISQFRDRVNKNNYVLNKYRNIDEKNKWSCICSCMDWISVAISYLSENPMPIQYGNDDLTSVNVYTYISCVDMVFEAIKQLHRIFVSEKSIPFENESSIFTENEHCKNDNDYFKLIRSCFGAHPVNLNDYFTSGNSKEKRFASWSGGHFSRRDYGVILYSNCPGSKDIFFDISFKEIDAFLVRTYEYLIDLISLIDEDDLIYKNPVRFADKMRNLDPAAERECFTAEEVSLLMTNLPRDRIGASIRLMLGTGMRTQEILALKPRHIEEDGSVIHIRQAINMIGGMAEVGVPTSRDSYRDIPVPPVLRPYALYLRNTVEKYIWESEKVKKPVNPTYFRKLYKAELDKIEGVRYLSPHSCRHTYVSQLQALGIDLENIKSIVGHADLDMTRHYLHVQEPIRQAAVQKLNDAITEKLEEK